MMISTKGRYALRVMIDLAEHKADGYVAMKTVAERQNISLKYLERILPVLVKAGMIEGVHGKGGGYRLTGEATTYRVGDILRLTEGNLAPVACLECGAAPCERREECRTIKLWENLHAAVTDYIDSVSRADLIKQE